MLCKMEDEGAEYSNALQEAQSLGFAEADPTADVEGLDVQAKIALLGKFCSEPKSTRFCTYVMVIFFVILAKIAFGKTIPVATVPTVGISKIGAVDFAFASSMRNTIKLLGTATVATRTTVSGASERSLSVFVSPTMVPLTSPLASAKGPGNMVKLQIISRND